MVTAGDFRNGLTFDMDGQVMQVVEFQHVKPGKGAAFVRTKLKNVISGAVTEIRPIGSARQNATYFDVRVAAPQGVTLLPGMNATVTIGE